MECIVKMINFSVVIPLYNKEKEIIETIHSVMCQSYAPDEIIVVDDGSTDNGVNIIKENFQDKIKLISQKNMGVSSARNRGISEAKNEYICLLDADDLWETGFLEEMEKLIKLFPEALFYSTSHKNIDERGEYLKSKLTFEESYIGNIENFIDTFRKNYGLVNSSSVCIRKSTKVIFPENEKRGEDICVWLTLSLRGEFAFSAKSLSVYRLNASNRSGQIHSEAIVPCQLQWFYKNKNMLQTYKYYKSIRFFIYSNIFITVYGGFALEKNHVSIDAVIDLMKKNGDWFYLILYPAYFLPVRLLDQIKKIRRNLR